MPRAVRNRRTGPQDVARFERRGGTLNDFVFPSRNDYMEHLSTRQYVRLVRKWFTGIGLQAEYYGTHSLRRTKASIIYEATGNLRGADPALSY
jgi:integrase